MELVVAVVLGLALAVRVLLQVAQVLQEEEWQQEGVALPEVLPEVVWQAAVLQQGTMV